MTQVCRQCSRVNPTDAAYCYWDGAMLQGHAGQGPINPGAQPFPNQFVFPSGQICRNFDQLATACQSNWKDAVGLLKQGFFSSFFGGLGRADLAMAAQEATRFPDQDRGMDQLLAKLPTNVLQAPQLKAEPAEINVGQVSIGIDRAAGLHLTNLGMRLLYGSVSSDSKWLTLGDGQGTSQKLFQFGGDSTIPVHIIGKHLRAGTKPLEGNLIIESNGGTSNVLVRVDVPISPFQGGVLNGSTSPRQIAEKARAAPNDAAPFFESGAVSQWFTKNGWTYPVQGPSVKGLGGIQQFFEALGLAKPPKVEVLTPSLFLRGDAGQSIQATIDLTTQEKKPVYAYATCEQHWVNTSKVKLAGRNANITVLVQSIPNRPGETLQTNVNVFANGSQRFKIPLSLTVVRGNPNMPREEEVLMVTADMVEKEKTLEVVELVSETATSPIMAVQSSTLPIPSPSQQYTSKPPSPSAGEGGDFANFDEDPQSVGTISRPVSIKKPTQANGLPFFVHLLPFLILSLVLLGLLLRDFFGTVPAGFTTGGEDKDFPVDPQPRLAIFYDYSKDLKEKREKNLTDTMMFGLTMRDPENPNNANPKKLTFDHRGRTNSFVALIDNQRRSFGKLKDGKWQVLPEGLTPVKAKAQFFITADSILITQEVELIGSEPVDVKGVQKRLKDICFIKYTFENKDTKTRKVGGRYWLDTLIGDNDGTAFTIPGNPNLVSTSKDFKTPQEVPDFIQTLENDDLQNPGTVAQVNFRLGSTIEPPSRVSLTLWQADKLDLYEIPVENIQTRKDSSIVLYWEPKDLEAGKKRVVGFSYGLGSLSVGRTPQLAMTVGGNLSVGGEITVVAYVGNPQAGQTATLKLPAGFTLKGDGLATQTVPLSLEKTADGRPRPSPVTWQLRAGASGTFDFEVNTSNGHSTNRKISIRKSSIF